MKDETSVHQSEEPVLCASGCGFFGSAMTMNMCSKCYRDHQRKQDQQHLLKLAKNTSFDRVTAADVLEKQVNPLSVSSEPDPIKAAVKTGPTRCGSCNKKVGLLGFKCKCGATFCGSHRHPEEHNCQIDYKKAGKEAIAKANPLVVADKVVKF